MAVTRLQVLTIYAHTRHCHRESGKITHEAAAVTTQRPRHPQSSTQCDEISHQNSPKFHRSSSPALDRVTNNKHTSLSFCVRRAGHGWGGGGLTYWESVGGPITGTETSEGASSTSKGSPHSRPLRGMPHSSLTVSSCHTTNLSRGQR